MLLFHLSLVRTGDSIDGYYKNPQQTAEKFVDGYFRTGDIGVRLAHDKIRIIDRKRTYSSLLKESLYPSERLEGFFENSSLIEQVYVYKNTQPDQCCGSCCFSCQCFAAVVGERRTEDTQ